MGKLNISFSILQGEFLIQLTDPDNEEIADDVNNIKIEKAETIVKEDGGKTLEESKIESEKPIESTPTQGGTRRRKINKRKRRTVKNNVFP
jgi:hypothetical protein